MRLTTHDGRPAKRQPNGKYCASSRNGRNWDVSKEQYFDTEADLIAAVEADPQLSVRMQSPKDNYKRGNAFVASKLLVDGKPLVGKT